MTIIIQCLLCHSLIIVAVLMTMFFLCITRSRNLTQYSTRKRRKTIKKLQESFKNHIIIDHEVVYRKGTPRIETLTWGNKNCSSNCRIDYVLRHGFLCVYGDLGEAVYSWYDSNISLEWISGCDIGYFHGKCLASEIGRNPKEWDGTQAKQLIQDYIRESVLDGGIGTRYYKDTEGARSALRSCLNSCYSRDEFNRFLYSDECELATSDQDWWEWLPTVGDVIPLRTKLHLLGLKMVFKKEVK